MRWESGRELKEFSTFGIGGPIRYFAEIRTAEEMREAFCFCCEEKIPFLVLGKGSNSLFDDAGFYGAVLLNRIDFCHWEEERVQVGSGFSFSRLGVQAAQRNLSGLEFAAGIPATVGGAIWMNAGAEGQQTGDALASVSFLDFQGTVRDWKREEMRFSYRTSLFQSLQGAILSATFCLSSSPTAKAHQLQLLDARKKKQPLQEKSCGCIFRNPPSGPSAGALIEKAGLKGLGIGGAFVSELHANFIVNRSGATSRDVQELIEKIRHTVYEKSGIFLELEIRIMRPHGLSR
ncbi:MAG: UDP-N-acetylmuramate dehydrogenase [Verrucomicrobiota bacterium]|nr:UDP-N-acetylmuramate dehydrogenase [Verrucomicrobiota bacterium]